MLDIAIYSHSVTAATMLSFISNFTQVLPAANRIHQGSRQSWKYRRNSGGDTMSCGSQTLQGLSIRMEEDEHPQVLGYEISGLSSVTSMFKPSL